MDLKIIVILIVATGASCISAGRNYHNPNKFIDLSHAFNNETVTWPGRKSTFYVEFEGETADPADPYWIASRGFCTSEHTSTHIDAPYHFHKHGRRLSEIPFEDLIDIPGVMIDIYDKVHKYQSNGYTVIENYAMTQADIIEWEEKNGKIPQGAVVLVRTGWGMKWGDNKAFRGEKGSPPSPPSDKPAEGDDTAVDFSKVDLNFPGFDATAARFLAVERQVLGVGVDVLSIDPGNKSKTFPAHRVFAARNIYMLEMVANLHLLPPRGFNLWMVPFKIDRGTGAPTRVLARVNNKEKFSTPYSDREQANRGRDL